MADQVRFQAGEGEFRSGTTAAHLAEPNNALIGLDLDHGRTKRPQCVPLLCRKAASSGTVMVVALMSVIFIPAPLP